MAEIAHRLREFLDRNGAYYGTLHHVADVRALQTAVDTNTPRWEFAKTVIARIDDRWAMVVVPADRRVDLQRLRRVLEAHQVRLATEDEMRKLFPDCELGAEPPFGNLYGMETYLDLALTRDERITFNAGTHEDVARMWFWDYERLVEPKVIDVAV